MHRYTIILRHSMLQLWAAGQEIWGDMDFRVLGRLGSLCQEGKRYLYQEGNTKDIHGGYLLRSEFRVMLRVVSTKATCQLEGG